MIRQNDGRFLSLGAIGSWIIEFGCAVFAVLFWVNKYNNIQLAPVLIVSIVQSLKDNGCFTKNMDIYWEKAFSILGLKVRMVETEEDADFCIYEWYNKRTNFTHFTAGKNDICLFDSLGRSVTVREGYIKSKRCFKRS